MSSSPLAKLLSYETTQDALRELAATLGGPILIADAGGTILYGDQHASLPTDVDVPVCLSGTEAGPREELLGTVIAERHKATLVAAILEQLAYRELEVGKLRGKLAGVESELKQIKRERPGAAKLDKLPAILDTLQEISHFIDVDTILDRILNEARKLANADAGSIFLVQGDELVFSYVHNETLSQGRETGEGVYSNMTVPISKSSIVGYAAAMGESVIIDDAYGLDPELPYSFNPSFDQKSGYHTSSIFTVPLKTHQDRLVGVMQIINARDESGAFVPFSTESRTYIPLFANNAAVTLERSIMTRERVLQMMKLAELRDPKETGPHVQRVGAYSAEIYNRYALKKGIPAKERTRFRDLIRIAAMLHDVGKVGIPDAILKKPGKLTNEEFDQMKWHTVFGARLFADATSALDEMCREIALSHHEKWAGRGYPGDIRDLMSDKAEMGEPVTGEEIPLCARIVALADVYDALCSRRCYKEPWPEEQVLETIRGDAGTHFDPELVETFFEIHDLILAIREKYQDYHPEDEAQGIAPSPPAV